MPRIENSIKSTKWMSGRPGMSCCIVGSRTPRAKLLNRDLRHEATERSRSSSWAREETAGKRARRVEKRSGRRRRAIDGSLPRSLCRDRRAPSPRPSPVTGRGRREPLTPTIAPKTGARGKSPSPPPEDPDLRRCARAGDAPGRNGEARCKGRHSAPESPNSGTAAASARSTPAPGRSRTRSTVAHAGRCCT